MRMIDSPTSRSGSRAVAIARLARTCIASLLVGVPVAQSATIAGTVRGPDGAAFRGAFVAAENSKTKITVSVLSNPQGHYRIPDLPAGDYQLFIRALGYNANPQTTTLTANQSRSSDFAIRRSPAQWGDVSGYAAKTLFPAGKMRDLIVQKCSICHFFQNRWVPLNFDAAGWKTRVEYMKALGAVDINPKDEADLATYLASLFGPDSVLPKSPEQAPGYQDTLRPVTDAALNIVYVEYEMPQPRYMPFAPYPDAKTGFVWIPNHGTTNKITRLDPKTGAMQDFAVPSTDAAFIHSAVPAPDGSVWLAEAGRSRALGRWDPATQKITEYVDTLEGHTAGPGDRAELTGGIGQRHTVRVDPNGNVWSSAKPLAKLDPKTGQYTNFFAAAFTYDIQIAANGDVWFTFPAANKIDKVDAKTLKLSMWGMPTPNMYPRRMAIAADGTIWVGENAFPFGVGKLARFDPKTEQIKEYSLPGPDPSPYAIGFDGDGYLWYNSHYMDTINRFDTKTGKVVEYPYPHAEMMGREFFSDAKGRVWYSSNTNNKVGYFYLAPKP